MEPFDLHRYSTHYVTGQDQVHHLSQGWCRGCGPHLLDHLGVLLHDVQEAVTLLGHGSCPLLGAARELLEQVRYYVVQAGAATRAYHCI